MSNTNNNNSHEEKEEEDMSSDEDGGTATNHRTKAPSNLEQSWILAERNFNKDRRQIRLWFARTFASPLLWMLYCLGYIFGTAEDTQDYVLVQDDTYRLFPGQAVDAGSNLPVPKTVYLGGGGGSNSSDGDTTDSTTLLLLNALKDDLNAVWGVDTIELVDTTTFDNENNNSTTASSLFQTYCNSVVGDASPDDAVCVYINTTSLFLENRFAFQLYFGGDDTNTPFDPILAATQHAIQSSLLGQASDFLTNATTTTMDGSDNNNNNYYYDIANMQRVPQLDAAVSTGADTYSLVFPGIMLLLSTTIAMQFIMAPLSTEKFKGIIRSFIMNGGVTLRVYLHTWLSYLSINALLTAALLTMVSIVWKIFNESSGILIFFSHQLAYVHLNTVALLLTQVSPQEELTQGLPWIMAIISAGLSLTVILTADPDSIVMYLLTVLSPFAGMLQFSALYADYDTSGYQVGIHPGDNVKSSGLLGCYVAQVLGIGLWNVVLWLWATPRRATPKEGRSGNDQDDADDDDQLDPTKFEGLPQNKEVLLSVQGLCHAYQTKGFLCSTKESKEVLKELNLNICRGEVFSYLGHNGSGKTTSIGIVSGELVLQEGTVTYHFQDGNAAVSNADDRLRIRRRIGICPQHNDALHGDVSARAFLRLFARLKGRLPIEDGQTVADAVEAEVERRLADISFTSPEDADKLIDTYSGGMKRKVCIALALLADPEVVFLDEPTGGIDPYNRRQVWDMIIAAKRGRCIILTTHFLDEADVLSDRVGILKDGHLVTCGSTLFLKHQIGGYNLCFDSDAPVDVSSFVAGAKPVELEKEGSHEWALEHGEEASFPSALRALNAHGATNVTLELTSLEDVFLETGKESEPTEAGSDAQASADDENEEDGPDEDIDEEEGVVSSESLKRIWERRGTITPMSTIGKFLHVTHFMLTNAWQIKGTIFLNIIMPLMYLVIGLVVIGRVDISDDEFKIPDPIPISPILFKSAPSQFFGIDALDNYSISPMVPTAAPQSLDDYFREGALPIAAGFFEGNRTLQYNETFSPFALQIGLQVLGSYSALLSGAWDGISVSVVQLPYQTQVFRIDLLMLPMCFAFGFAGLVFSVLDVLLLKADNVVGLFRVTGITEWSTYLGVTLYKTATTFLPFFVLVLILGFSLGSVVMGNGGRWVATIVLMLSYAFSNTPLGLIFAKRFITSDFKSVANWFPGVYFTAVSLPYIAWNIALQVVPEARDALLVVGDILCIFPPVAFQRGLGAVIEVSTEFDDDDLTWGTVWSWENRVWFPIAVMIAMGSFEWWYLYRLTTKRPPTTVLKDEEKHAANPIDSKSNFGVVEETERSHVDNNGIKARELVKVFHTKPQKGSKQKKSIVKSAVKGVSFGVKKNEIYAVIGPNGAGKTTTMAMLAGEYTPEHGELALAGESLNSTSHGVGHLFAKGNIAMCPQFDALFPKKTVQDHLEFYAKVRGLDLHAPTTIEHINAIVRLLGLQKYKKTLSTDLSGGYKRRLCLANAMIGYPDVLMVDECTTGMDPNARHLVWEVLKPPDRDNNDNNLPAILLSTHYMDEASELGDRIGIFIDGEIVSTGSLPSLQAEYCKSYFVEVALRSTASAEAQDQTLDIFAEKGMQPEVYESLPFHFKLKVPFRSNSGSHLEQLACIFELLEMHREELGIKFYSVAQMSLEQIFIDLSRRQFAADESTRVLSFHQNESSTRLL